MGKFLNDEVELNVCHTQAVRKCVYHFVGISVTYSVRAAQSMDDYTNKLIERTRQRREQLEGKTNSSGTSQNDYQRVTSKSSPRNATAEPVTMRNRSETKVAHIAGEQTRSNSSDCRATAVLVELRPAGKASSGTTLPAATGSGAVMRNEDPSGKSGIAGSESRFRGSKETVDYPRTMAQRLEIWQKRISEVESQSNPSAPTTAQNTHSGVLASSNTGYGSGSTSTSSMGLPPKSPTLSKRIAGTQQRLIEQGVSLHGVSKLSPKIAKPTPFVSTFQQAIAANADSGNASERPAFTSAPLYGRPSSRANSTYYAAGGANAANKNEAEKRIGSRSEFDAKLNAMDQDSDTNSIAKRLASEQHTQFKESEVPPAKRVSLSRKASNSSLVVPFNPELDTPRGFGSRSRSPSVSSRHGSTSQLPTQAATATDSESNLSDSSDRLRMAAVRTFMNRRAQEARTSDVPKNQRDDSQSRSRIRFGENAVRILTDTETENENEQPDSEDDACLSGDQLSDDDVDEAARLESLQKASDSLLRRTRHTSEPAGAVASETHTNTAPATKQKAAEPAKHAISVTKLGGTLHLASDAASWSGSSLYSEITKELAKQNELVNEMLADAARPNVPTRNDAPQHSRMDSSDWSAVTSLSELESEDDLKPSMNSTKLTNQSQSIMSPTPTPIYANLRSAPQPEVVVLREREPQKRLPQLPETQQSQQHGDMTMQRSRSIRARIEQLLASADQQDEIIKQASAALARCKQIQQRIAMGQYGTQPDSLASALPIQEFVEANRVLLIACQRRQACLAEVEHFKTKTIHDVDLDQTGERRGSMTVDSLRFGLKREFLERSGAFANEVHYALVTLRIGSQVLVSQMVNTEHDVDLRTRCIEVPNKFQFEIGPSFTAKLQVFCLTTAKELGVVSRAASSRTSTLSSMIPTACMSSKHSYDDAMTIGSQAHLSAVPHYATPGKSVRSSKKESKKKKKNLNDLPGWSMAASSFSEVGSLEITMRCVSANTFVLERTPPLLCPLDGSVHMRLALQMESGVELRGFLTMFEDVAGVGSWHRRWFLLKNDLIRFWKYPDDEFRKEPLGVIRLDQCVNDAVQPVSREKCARPNTFELLILVRQVQPLTATSPSTRSKPQMLVYSYLLSADTKDDRAVWCEKLNANVAFLRTWYSDRMPKPFKQQSAMPL